MVGAAAAAACEGLTGGRMVEASVALLFADLPHQACGVKCNWHDALLGPAWALQVSQAGTCGTDSALHTAAEQQLRLKMRYPHLNPSPKLVKL